MKNILVTGSNGQLGKEIKTIVKKMKYYKYKFYFTDKNTLDITDKKSIETFCKQQNITHIINCAAYTSVDKAEKSTKNAKFINHIAVNFLAEISKYMNISLIHISTDYVFDGTNHRPYTEKDIANPLNIYGKTKLEGEKSLININPKKSIIIRTSWLYSNMGNNFVKTILKLAKKNKELSIIYDQISTPTYANDLAKIILDLIIKQKLIDIDTVTTYHYSNEGVASWYDFAKEIINFSNTKCHLVPIKTEKYPTLATRPYYTLLDKSKIKNDFDIIIPNWKDSLYKCLGYEGKSKIND